MAIWHKLSKSRDTCMRFRLFQRRIEDKSHALCWIFLKGRPRNCWKKKYSGQTGEWSNMMAAVDWWQQATSSNMTFSPLAQCNADRPEEPGKWQFNSSHHMYGKEICKREHVRAHTRAHTPHVFCPAEAGRPLLSREHSSIWREAMIISLRDGTVRHTHTYTHAHTKKSIV